MTIEETAGNEPTRSEIHDRVRRLEITAVALAVALAGAVGWAVFAPRPTTTS